MTFKPNNQLEGPGIFSYDPVGNLTSQPNPMGAGQMSLMYDSANRLKQAYIPSTSTETYLYFADNRRAKKTLTNGTTEYYFYGIEGILLGTYTQSSINPPKFLRKEPRYWFGGRLIRVRKEGTTPVEETVITDRLRSVVWKGGVRYKYAPSGEELGTATP